MGKVKNDKIRGVEEMRRDRFREIVECEVEAAEGIEEADFRWDVAGEGFVGEGELSDTVASADDSRPVTWGGVKFRPGLKDVRWVGFNGGFEGEEGEAVGVERGSK